MSGHVSSHQARGRTAGTASLAPKASYPLTTVVGPPAGAPLTLTTGIPAADATEDLVLTHPISGQTVTRSVSVWRRRRWTTVITPNPPPGATYLFDECQFDVAGSSWVLEVNETNGVANQMQPLVVFRRCGFNGGATSSIALAASYVWLIGCNLYGCEDGWAGAAYSVAEGCNFIGMTDSLVDPHADGVQLTGTGKLSLYRCFISAGNVIGAMNAGLRIGTEFGAVDGIDVYYCTLDSGGYSMQVRGDSGVGDITGFAVLGCRWVPNAVYGPIDFEETTIDVWLDNAHLDGTVIGRPT